MPRHPPPIGAVTRCAAVSSLPPLPGSGLAAILLLDPLANKGRNCAHSSDNLSEHTTKIARNLGLRGATRAIGVPTCELGQMSSGAPDMLCQPLYQQTIQKPLNLCIGRAGGGAAVPGWREPRGVPDRPDRGGHLLARGGGGLPRPHRRAPGEPGRPCGGRRLTHARLGQRQEPERGIRLAPRAARAAQQLVAAVPHAVQARLAAGECAAAH